MQTCRLLNLPEAVRKRQLMKVDIEVETPSESLDQGNRASFGFWLILALEDLLSFGNRQRWWCE